MYLRKKKRKQRRFNNNIFDLEKPIINSIQTTNSFLKDVKYNLKVPIINSIQNTNSFLVGVKNNYFPFMNSIINNSNNSKMGKVLNPSLFLLMLVFSYSVKSQITAQINTKTMMSQLDDAVSSMKVKSAAYKQKLPTAEKILSGLKGWQDAFDMNVNFQLQKIGVPTQLHKMWESRIGKKLVLIYKLIRERCTIISVYAYIDIYM
jgi:hypothetical protein